MKLWKLPTAALLFIILLVLVLSVSTCVNTVLGSPLDTATDTVYPYLQCEYRCRDIYKKVMPSGICHFYYIDLYFVHDRHCFICCNGICRDPTGYITNNPFTLEEVKRNGKVWKIL